jgi:hypothetical protein
MPGLQYHDIVAENDVYKKAISRLTPEEQEARARRIRRAIDLSAKVRRRTVPGVVVCVWRRSGVGDVARALGCQH